MIEDLVARAERLFRPEKRLYARGTDTFFLKDVVYCYTAEGKTLAVTEQGQTHEITQNLDRLEKLFPGVFLRTHRSFLAVVDRIMGIFERYPEEPGPETRTGRDAVDECELALRGSTARIPVTSTYAGGVKKALRIESLHHVIPEHPEDRHLRLLEIIDFGWRELYSLDPKDAAAVKAFKDAWDIKQFAKDRMLVCFRMVGTNEINKKRVIKNIIYQMFRWIQKGIERPSDGNIRSLWYKIKTVLAQHSDIFGSDDVDTFYITLQEMVEEQKLFRYKDFGFMDMNETFRGIGSRRPDIILASEKLGHYLFIKPLAMGQGVSFICLKGEPAVISLEYFSDDLKEAVQGKEVTIFCISDIDQAGYSIERNLVEGLKQRGLTVNKVVKLVDPSIFTTEEIMFVRYPVVRYHVKGDQIKPQGKATLSQVTKTRQWYAEELKDNRFYSEETIGGGWTQVTIWGIESDAADREKIKQRFLSGLGRRRR